MTVNPAELIESGTRTGLVVVAHPDDETIGAAGLMSRLHRCQLIHVTDGAPREPRFWTQAPGAARAESRTEYARIRRTELARALGLAGIEARCASGLGVVDMEAVLVLGAIAQRLANAIASLRPDFVITHDYAGGHPDHDAVAFAAWGASRLLARRGIEPPPIYEMALYHGAGGGFHVGEFVPRRNGVPGASGEVEVALSEQERAIKRGMLDCFESQRDSLAPFYELGIERFRLAPHYDFTQPPHEGQLLYERNGFPMSGERWRSFVVRALRSFEVPGQVPGGEVSGQVPGEPKAARAVPAREVEQPASAVPAPEAEQPEGKAGTETAPEAGGGPAEAAGEPAAGERAAGEPAAEEAAEPRPEHEPEAQEAPRHGTGSTGEAHS